MDVSIELLMLLFFVAALAGWVDTLAGGGGLIVLPVLMLSGLSPVQALATNKCQGFVGTLTATVTLFLRKQLSMKGLLPRMAWVAVGASIGTLLIQNMQTQWMAWAVPLLLMAVAFYFLFSPNLGRHASEPKMTERLWRKTVACGIGFYDGFFGPGTGSFFAASGVYFRGQTLVAATIAAKPLNFTSNIVSLGLFAAGGQVIWAIGLVMMVGQMLGAVLGTYAITGGGARLIRPLVIFMCVALSLRQLYSLLG